MGLSIGNKYLEICVDSEDGRLTSLKNRITGDDYLKLDLRSPLYKLSCISLSSGEKVEVVPDRVISVEEITGDKDISGESTRSLVVKFKSALAGEAEPVRIHASVRMEVREDDAETLWFLELSNSDERYLIVEILFPCFRGVYLGESWQDDIMIYPHHAGEKTLAPVREYTSERYLGFWRAGTKRGNDGVFFREINYCGLASMNWMYYYDDENGLYISSYDRDFTVTGLRVETGGPDDPWMGWAMRKYATVNPGETWNSHPYGVGITTDDWHFGASRYREWIDGVIQMPDNPLYLKDETILNQCYNFKRDGVIYNRFGDIPSMYERGQDEYGMRHMFIASWNRSGFDQDYPEYHPDLELGTCWELAEGCRYVNENGGFITFYVNSRIFHMESDYFETLGRKWAIKDEAGKKTYEQYGPHKFVVLCPSNKAWQDYLIDVGSWMAKSYGATGIYLDQLGSAEPFPCYDKSHTHEDIGSFNRGYIRVLKDLLERVRSINPDSFLMIENCGDIYGSYVWGNLTWNGDPYDEFYNLYKYTFPEYVQVNMCNPKRHLTGEARATKFYYDLNRALLLGSVFWVGLDKTESLDDDLHEYLKAAIGFRKRLNPFFKAGRFIDNEDVIQASPGLEVSHWRLKDAGDLYIMANPNKGAGKYLVVKHPAYEVGDVLTFNIHGNEGFGRYVVTDDVVEICVPESEVSSVLILRK
jgi:hypothetical protein